MFKMVITTIIVSNSSFPLGDTVQGLLLVEVPRLEGPGGLAMSHHIGVVDFDDVAVDPPQLRCVVAVHEDAV